MKKIAALVFMAFAVVTARAQESPFQKGSNVISAGIGLGSSIGNYTGSTPTPAFSIQYERGVWDIPGPGVVSLGGYAGIKSYKYSSSYLGYNYRQQWNYTVIGIRGAYHYNGFKIEKLDLYGGVMLSYNLLKYKYENTNSSYNYGLGNYGSTAGFTLFAGARYFFLPYLGAFAEAGYGVSFLTVGLSGKF